MNLLKLFYTHQHQLIKYASYTCIILVFLALILHLYHPPTAWFQDLGRHLKLGEIILNQHFVPKTNFFSYTHPGYPFINHHWLSEVIFYLLYQSGGNIGLGLLKIITLTTALTISILTAKKNAPLHIIAPVLVLMLPIYLERTHIRPEIFSMLLFSLLLYTLSKTLNKLNFFLILTLILLWVNLHIYFAIGLITLYIFAFDKIIRQKNCRPLILALSSTIICLINPNTLAGLLAPFQILNQYGYTIIENQSPFFLDDIFNNPAIAYFKLSLILTLPLNIYALYKKKFFPSLLLIFLTLLSVQQIRNFPLYAISVIGLLPPIVYQISKSIPKHILHPLTFTILTISLLIPLNLLHSRLYPQTLAAKTNHQPLSLTWNTNIHAVFEFINQHQLTGPIFNNFDVGGLIIYHQYPEIQTFVDNRPEAFPASFFTDTYIPMQQNLELFNQISSSNSFNAIIFAHTDITPWGQTFIKNIIHHPQFTLVYLDTYHVVFVNNQTYPQLIKSHVINSDNVIEYLQNNISPNSLNQLSRLTQIINLFNWQDADAYLNQKTKFTTQ